jgi:hypothetical protein
MRILFPASDQDPSAPDEAFRIEFSAAKEAGFYCEFYGHRELVRQSTEASLQNCREADRPGEPIVLRGWMVSPETYRLLYEGLLARGYAPLTNPEQYIEAHYLPHAYRHLEGHTPESQWLEGRDLSEAWQLYQNFKADDAVIKDYAKSAKHRWREACFLSANTSKEHFTEIYRSFLDARGALFQKGIVIRKFYPLVGYGRDMRGIPIVEEFRLFYWKKRLLLDLPKCLADESQYVTLWQSLANRFSSDFISMDVAALKSGGWTVIEVGDGGVSGLSRGILESDFYLALAAANPS